jgi:hypothetical protein
VGPASSQLKPMSPRRPSEPSTTVPSPCKLSCGLDLLPSLASTASSPFPYDGTPLFQRLQYSTSQCEPSRRLSFPPSGPIRDLLLIEPPFCNRIPSSNGAQMEHPASPTLPPSEPLAATIPLPILAPTESPSPCKQAGPPNPQPPCPPVGRPFQLEGSLHPTD